MLIVSLRFATSQKGMAKRLLLYRFMLTFCFLILMQIEKPLQRHGGRLEHNETYCGSCYGAEAVCFFYFNL